MEWDAVGAAAAGLILGAAAWLRERGRRKAATDPWDGHTERRHRPERITGSRVVALLEAGRSPMPRHWAEFVDARAQHKVSNAIAPLVLQMGNIEADVKELKGSIDDVKENVETLKRIANRLIGRLLPDEPVG